MAISHCTLQRVGAAAAGLLLSFVPGEAAQAAQATGSASAAILAPVTVSKQNDLAFGKVIAGPTPSSVTVTPAGGFTCGTGLTCLDANSPARFVVAGAPGQTVRIDLDQQIVLTSPSGGRMTATLQPSASVMRMTGPGGGGAGSTNILGIGGVLNVGAYQAEGVYTGTFTVNIDYS